MWDLAVRVRVRVRVSSLVFVARNVGGRKLNICNLKKLLRKGKRWFDAVLPKGCPCCQQQPSF